MIKLGKPTLTIPGSPRKPKLPDPLQNEPATDHQRTQQPTSRKAPPLPNRNPQFPKRPQTPSNPRTPTNTSND